MAISIDFSAGRAGRAAVTIHSRDCHGVWVGRCGHRPKTMSRHRLDGAMELLSQLGIACHGFAATYDQCCTGRMVG